MSASHAMCKPELTALNKNNNAAPQKDDRNAWNNFLGWKISELANMRFLPPDSVIVRKRKEGGEIHLHSNFL